MSTSVKKQKGGSVKDDSSWFGRYIAQKTLRQAARNNAPNSGLTAGLAALSAPALGPGAYALNEVTQNKMTLPNPKEGYKNLTDAERDILERSWPDQLLSGLKQSAGWGLASGLAGGLANAGISKFKGEDIDLSDLALWAAVSGGVGGAAPIGSAVVNKFLLEKLTTKSDRNTAKKTVSNHPGKTALPFGDAIGAINR